MTNLNELVKSKELLIFCGPGGVGKTTVAAATAIKIAADFDKRVLVLTIDPARRLASALGIKNIGNVVTEIDLAKELKSTPKGRLFASMLDTKQSWDDLIKRHAPDQESVDKILHNRLYQNITAKFIQSHEYVAMERVYELHGSVDYDMLIIDTPPTRNALDFLDAPERMADFFSSRLLKWLIIPYRSRFYNLASKPFYQLADRVLGSQFVQDIAEFFLLFQSMYDGFVVRAKSVKALLSNPSCGFIVVSTLETVPQRESSIFVEELLKRSLKLQAIIANKVLPEYLADEDVLKKIEASKLSLEAQVDFIKENTKLDSNDVKRVLNRLYDNYFNFARVSLKEQVLKRDFERLCGTVLTAGFTEERPVSIKALKKFSDLIWQKP